MCIQPLYPFLELTDKPPKATVARNLLGVTVWEILETVMRRWGALLMIIGANIAVAAIAAALWRAVIDCSVKAAGGACEEGAFSLFVSLLFSVPGLVYWAVVVVALLIFWRGIKMRRDA